ncbi:MAG TPA: DUF488 domain-containing protein [Kofleriaceae bacterium]|nr:DUF488 domain-containing protein [Kofleriaceae bacterium]
MGHSTRSADELVAALAAWQVTCLVDIRHFTRSRANPQFNADAIAPRLARDGITYVWLADLGGRRGRCPDCDPARNAGWTHPAFKNYADYAETAAFRAAFDRLVELAGAQTCAIMCAEAVWWRCHRRIVADYALTRGLRVFHIFTEAKAERATRTPFAKLDRKTRTLRYPAVTAPRAPRSRSRRAPARTAGARRARRRSAA